MGNLEGALDQRTRPHLNFEPLPHNPHVPSVRLGQDRFGCEQYSVGQIGEQQRRQLPVRLYPAQVVPHGGPHAFLSDIDTVHGSQHDVLALTHALDPQFGDEVGLAREVVVKAAVRDARPQTDLLHGIDMRVNPAIGIGMSTRIRYR